MTRRQITALHGALERDRQRDRIDRIIDVNAANAGGDHANKLLKALRS